MTGLRGTRATGLPALLASLLGSGLILSGCATPSSQPAGSGPHSGGRTPVVLREGPAPRHEQDRPPRAGTVPHDIERTPDPVPKVEPRSRYGNPASYVVFGRTYHTLDSAEGYRERGTASWYGEKFHGRRTSSGEPYDMFEMTAAHKTLPLPSYVRVTHLQNGRSIIVRVNDRGPFHDNRIIDLSYAAATRLGMIQAGQAPVEVVALTSPGPAGTPVQTVAAPAPAPVTQHYLEAGSFEDPVSAVSMRESVVALGVQTVEIRVLEAGDLARHQVLIGPFTDADARARTMSYLEANRIPARIFAP